MLNTINRKIFFSYLTLIFLVLILVGVSFTFLLEDHIISTRSNDQISTGKELTTLARTILTEFDQDHSELLFFLDRALETRVWIVDDTGNIIKSSRPEAQLERGLVRISPEEMDILMQGEIISHPPNKNYYNTLMLSTGIPVIKGGRVIGGVFLHYPISGVRGTISQVQTNLLNSAIFAVVLTGFFSFWFSKSISRPILEMDLSARALAEGDFSKKIESSRKDELGTLSKTFNHMASQLQNTLNQLSQERDKLAHTVSSIEEGVLALNRDRIIILANQPAINFFRPDKTPVEFNGAKINELITSPEVLELIDKALAGRDKYSELIELEGNLTIFFQSFPIRNNSGEIIGIVALLHNLRNLDGLEEVQRKFFAGVSHELKTPLTAIRSYAQALLDGTAGDSKTRERFTKIICEEAENLGNLINELLDYSRLKAGKIEPRWQEFNLEELISEVLAGRKLALQDKKITVRKRSPSTEIPAGGDPSLIRIVMANLLDNAITFTPPQETIAIEIREEEKIWISIIDSGPGIPVEEIPFIWERFFRGKRNNPESGRGWGLGLALAREIIVAHGETISVQNRKNRGSVFSFSLPKK